MLPVLERQWGFLKRSVCPKCIFTWYQFSKHFAVAAEEMVSPPLHSVLQYLPISIHKHWTKLMSKCREQFLSYANCFETIPHQWLGAVFRIRVVPCVCPPPWLLTPPLTGVSTPVCARAWNGGYMKVREDFTERAPTRAFSWLKAPTSAFTFKILNMIIP